MAIGLFGDVPTETTIGRIARQRRRQGSAAGLGPQQSTGLLAKLFRQGVESGALENDAGAVREFFKPTQTFAEKAQILGGEATRLREQFGGKDFGIEDLGETFAISQAPGADRGGLESFISTKEAFSKLFGVASQVFEGASGEFQTLQGQLQRRIRSQQATGGVFGQAGAAAEASGLAAFHTAAQATLTPALLAAGESPEATARAPFTSFALFSGRLGDAQKKLFRGAGGNI